MKLPVIILGLLSLVGCGGTAWFAYLGTIGLPNTETPAVFFGALAASCAVGVYLCYVESEE